MLRVSRTASFPLPSPWAVYPPLLPRQPLPNTYRQGPTCVSDDYTARAIN